MKARSIVLLLLAALACALLPAAAGGARSSAEAKPQPVYWGAWIGEQLTGTDAPWDMNAVAKFEQVVGKGLSLIEFSSSWQDCSRKPCRNYRFPSGAMDDVRAYGAIPVFSWGAEATPSPGPEQPDFQLADITGGAWDPYIAQFASEARDWGHPFFLRFNWEMNGDWFPWNEGVNGNQPGEYVAAWRHVHDVFTAVGATNATWVWCPFVAGSRGKRQGQPLKQLYPGTGYVDWTCMDGYNWGPNPVNPQKWRSFSELFGPTYGALTKKIAPDKPLMLGEFGTTPYGGHKALWIKKMFQQLPFEYPRIRALIYFNSFDRGVDWPLETSPTAAGAFARGIHKGIYANNRFGELATSPIQPLR